MQKGLRDIVENQSSPAILRETAIKGGGDFSSDARIKTLVLLKVRLLRLKLRNIPFVGADYLFQISDMHLGQAKHFSFFLQCHIFVLYIFLKMRNDLLFFLYYFLLLSEVFRTEALAAVSPDIALLALSVHFLLEFSFLLLRSEKLRLSHGEKTEKALFVSVS